MIKIVAKVRVKEDKINEFRIAAKELVEKSMAEDGNISYSLNVSIKNECDHAFIEIWKDNDAIEKHNSSEHFTTILPKLSEMAAAPMEIEMYKEV